MAFRKFFRWTVRIILYFSLITLPFNFQALLAGALFAKYHNDRITRGSQLYMSELDSFSWMDQWSVPGAPSIWDVEDNDHYPFFIPRLRSNTWGHKLALTVPGEYREDFLDGPIDKPVAFDGAVRDVSCHPDSPMEYWVYVSRLAMPELYEWDREFVRLLEWHELHPLTQGTKFAYVDCATSPFLCHIWQVQYPALVHFKINETGAVGEDVDPEAFTSPKDQLRPLEVRIFDLGLQQEVSPLPPGVFPSRFEQMKALTTGEGAYTFANEYNELLREYHQFNELYYFLACNKPGSFLDYTSEIDNWLLKRILTPIGLKDIGELLAGTAFSVSLVFGALFYLIANPISDFWTNFVGQRTETDDLAEQIAERVVVKERGGVFGDMHLGMLHSFEDYVQSKAAESATQPALTTHEAEVKNLFAGLRANLSSIWGVRKGS